MEDIDRLAKLTDGFCFCGDYNCSFADNYYFTKAGRSTILNKLKENNLSLLTKARAECIDHIAITKAFIMDASIQIEEWNYERTLSDHKGIVVTF